MSKKYVVGIDYGTLSARAVVVSVSDGSELGTAEMEYPHGVMDTVLSASGETLPADFALQDPEDYLTVLKHVVPEALRRAGVDTGDAAGIGIDFTTCTVLPAYGDATPLCHTPAFRREKHAYCKLWKHHAGQPYADRINAAAAGADWLTAFGGKMSPECIYPKIWETLDCAPEVYADAAYFLEAGDWLTWCLTGRQTRSYMFAAFKAGYLPGRGYPPADFFTGLDPRFSDLFEKKMNAPVVGTASCAGYLTAGWASLLGLPAGLPVAAPVADSHVAAPALGVTEPGQTFAIFGTSNAYDTLTEEYHDIRGICGCVEDALYPGLHCCVSGLCCVGDLFGWMADHFSDTELTTDAAARGVSPIARMIEKAAANAPGECGLVALDWWNGNRSILVRGDLSGLIVGLTLQTRPEDVMRALIEATAFATRVIFDEYRRAGVQTRSVVAAGGIARKNPFIMQLYADVLRVPVSVTGTAQAPALGSAVMAAAAAGIYPSLAEASERMRSPAQAVYEPRENASAVYDRLYAEYLALYDLFGRGGTGVMPRLRRIASENAFVQY